jgi:hypothetical protein
MGDANRDLAVQRKCVPALQNPKPGFGQVPFMQPLPHELKQPLVRFGHGTLSRHTNCGPADTDESLQDQTPTVCQPESVVNLHEVAVADVARRTIAFERQLVPPLGRAMNRAVQRGACLTTRVEAANSPSTE